MLNKTFIGHVYLACGITDLRKSIDGLAILVQESFDLDPFSDCLFVFCNRHKNKIKILQWEHDGFWLHYKSLEKGTYRWPKASESKTINVGERELRWLLDGLNLDQKQAHKAVKACIMI